MIRIVELLINNEDYSDYATIPLQTQDTLDESLDIAYIELKGIDKEVPFLPFSDVYLKTIDDKNNIKEHYMFIESDEPTEIISHKVYDHNVLLIEQTKWTERFFAEKSITNPLVHNYYEGRSSVYVTMNNTLFWFIPSGSYNVNFKGIESPILIDKTIKILRPYFLMKEISRQAEVNNTLVNIILTIVAPDGTKIIKEDGWASMPQEKYFDFTPNQLGEYKFYIDATSSTSINKSTGDFSVYVISETKAKDDYTIKDAFNLLLFTTETLRETEKPRFRLAEISEYIDKDEEYKKRVEKILNLKSPDFAFGKMSLFEALKTIGDYGHFMPRVKNKVIFLDLYGMDNKAVDTELENYCSYTSNQSTNNFCSKLDSQIDNLVNLDSNEQGSVVTPLNDAYKTLRSQTGEVVITDTNIIIPTEDAIEKIVKLELGLLKGNIEVGDITPYVYEQAEYDALSSYSDDYPNSRMYALKYTQGSKNITGLSFKREKVGLLAFESSAIKNIIFRKLNRDINWWNSFWNTDDIFKIQYRLTYIPNTSTRVTQSKAYKGDIHKTTAIAYNQGASKVSSNAYGENLKGQVLKLGNIEKQKLYILPTLDLVPKCGLKFDDDYYISVVKCEYYPNFIKCELGLSKDYNNKNAYIEVNSQLRYYEVSEKSALNIYKIFEDYCEIGYDNQSDNLSLITNNGINKFANSFNYGYQDTNITMVKAKSLDKNNISLGEFAMPITSLGIGNSILLSYHYEDNYSAGNSAHYQGEQRIQQMQSYVDIYGEVEKLSLKYGKNTTIVNDFDSSINTADKLPLATEISNMEIILFKIFIFFILSVITCM